MNLLSWSIFELCVSRCVSCLLEFYWVPHVIFESCEEPIKLEISSELFYLAGQLFRGMAIISFNR